MSTTLDEEHLIGASPHLHEPIRLTRLGPTRPNAVQSLQTPEPASTSHDGQSPNDSTRSSASFLPRTLNRRRRETTQSSDASSVLSIPTHTLPLHPTSLALADNKPLAVSKHTDTPILSSPASITIIGRARADESDSTGDRLKRRRPNDVEQERDAARAETEEALRLLEDMRKKLAGVEKDHAEQKVSRRKREKQADERRVKDREERAELEQELQYLRRYHYEPEYPGDPPRRRHKTDSVTTRSASAVAQQEALEHDAAESRAMYTQARQDIAELEAELKAAKEAAASAEGKEISLAAEKVQAERDRDDAVVKLSGLQDTIHTLSIENSTFQQVLADRQTEVNEDVRALRTTNHSLSTENDILLQQVSVKEKALAELRLEKREMVLARISNDQKVANLQEDLKLADRRLDESEARMGRAERAVQDLESGKRFLEMEKDQLKRDADQTRAVIVDLRSEHRDLSVDRDRLASRLKIVSDAEEFARSTIIALQEEKASHVRQLARAADDLRVAQETVSAHETETNDLLKQLEITGAEEAEILRAARAEIQSLSSADAELTQKYEASRMDSSTLSSLQAEYRQLQADDTTLASQYDDLYDRSQEYLASIAELESRLSTPPIAVESASIPWKRSKGQPGTGSGGAVVDPLIEDESDFQIIESATSRTRETAQRPKKRSTIPSPNGSELKSHVLARNAQLKEKDREIIRLQMALDSATTAKANLESVHNEATAGYEGVTTQYRQALEQATVKTREHQSDIQRIETELERARTDRDTFASLNKRLTLEKGALSDKLQALEDDALYLGAPSDDLSRKTKDLEAKLNEARPNGARYKSERDGMRVAHDEMVHRFNRLEQARAELQDQVDRSMTKAERRFDEVDSKELAHAHKTIEDLTAELSTKQAELDLLQAETSLLQLDLETARESATQQDALLEERDAIRAEAEHLRLSVIRLETLQERTETDGDVAAMARQAGVGKPEADIPAMQASIDALTSDITRLQAELDVAADMYNTRMDHSRAESADQIYELSGTIENLNGSLEELRGQLSASTEMAAEAQREVEGFGAENARLTAVMEGMRGAAEIISAELSVLKMEKQEVLEEIEEMRAAQGLIVNDTLAETAENRASIDQLEAEILRLKTERDETTKRHLLQRVGSRVERDGLSGEITSLRARIEQLQEEAAEAQQRVSDMVAAAEATQLQMADLVSAKQHLTAELKKERDQAKLAITLRQQDEKTKKSGELEKMSKTIGTLLGKVAAGQSNLASKQLTIDSIKADIVRMGAMMNAQHVQHTSDRDLAATEKDGRSRQIADLSARVEKYVIEIQEAQQRAEVSVAAAKAAQLEAERVAGENEALSRANMELRQEAVCLNTNIAEMRKALERAGEKLAAATTEIASHHEIVGSRGSETSRLREIIAELEPETARLRDELVVARRDRVESDTLSAENIGLAAKCAQLEQVVESHEKQIWALKLQVSTEQQQAERFASEAATAKQEVEQLGSRTSTLLSTIETSRQSIKDLESELATAKREKAQLQEEAKTSNTAISAHQQDVATHLETISKLEAEIAASKENVSQLQAALNTARPFRTQRDAARTEITSLRNQIDSLTGYVRDRDAELAKLRIEQNESASQLAAAKAASADWQNRSSAQVSNRERLEKQLVAVRASLGVAEKEKAVMAKERLEEAQRIFSLKTEIDSQRSTILTYGRSISHRDAHITMLNAAASKAEATRKEADEALAGLPALLAELASLRKALETTKVEWSNRVSLLVSTQIEKRIQAETLSKELAAAKAALEEARAAKTVLEQEHQSLSVTADNFKWRVEAANITISSQSEMLRHRVPKSEADNLQADLDSACAKAEAARLEADKSKNASSELSRRNAELLAQIEFSKTTIARHRAAIDSLTKTVREHGDRKAEAEKLAETNRSLMAENDKLRATIVSDDLLHNQALDCKSLELLEAQSSVRSLEEDVARLQSTLDNVNANSATFISFESALRGTVKDLSSALVLNEQQSGVLVKEVDDLKSRLGSSMAEVERLGEKLAAADDTVAQQKKNLERFALKELGQNIALDTLHDRIKSLRAQLTEADNGTQATIAAHQISSEEAEVDNLRLNSWAEELDSSRVELEEELLELRLKDRRKFTAAKLCAQLFSPDAAEDAEVEDFEWSYGPDPWMEEVVARYKGMAEQSQKTTEEKEALLHVALSLEKENNSLKENLGRVETYLIAKFPDYADSVFNGPPTPGPEIDDAMRRGGQMGPPPPPLNAAPRLVQA